MTEAEVTDKKLEDIFMSYLEKIPDDLKLGEEREVVCVCGGKLFIGKSKLNGHIRMACNKCKFQLMQQKYLTRKIRCDKIKV